MPSTGTPSPSTAGSAGGASASYTEHGPPERITPMGFWALISSIEAVQGKTTEKTFCSRTRRAMSCTYCAPKSRMTIEEVSIRNRLQMEVHFQFTLQPQFSEQNRESPDETSAITQ